jgi:hypothetical protein
MGRFRGSTLAAELETKQPDSPFGSPITDIRNRMSAPPDCAEHVRRRVATVSAFLSVGFSCVYEATVNSKPRINRSYHRPRCPPEPGGELDKLQPIGYSASVWLETR